MLYLFSLLAGLALIADYPWVREALLRPMDDERRTGAPGAFVELTDGLTHYQWHGPRSNRVLVLVHGQTYPSWVFSGLIKGLLGMRYHILSYDLYGRGYSDRPKTRQSLDFHIRQLDELLFNIGVNVPVTMLGYSMGGTIAAGFAAQYAERVERLILLAPLGLAYTPMPLLQRATRLGLLGDWLWGMFAARKLQRRAQTELAEGSVIPDLAQRVSAELNSRGYLPALLSSERFTLSQSLEEPLQEIKAMYIPTLVIWGGGDHVIPQQAPGMLSVWNRHARQSEIEGAGHALIHTHPKQVLGAIRTFLREVPE